MNHGARCLQATAVQCAVLQGNRSKRPCFRGSAAFGARAELKEKIWNGPQSPASGFDALRRVDRGFWSAEMRREMLMMRVRDGAEQKRPRSTLECSWSHQCPLFGPRTYILYNKKWNCFRLACSSTRLLPTLRRCFGTRRSSSSSIHSSPTASNCELTAESTDRAVKRAREGSTEGRTARRGHGGDGREGQERFRAHPANSGLS